MDIRSEIKSLIAKRAKTLKQVCEELEELNGKKITPNNLANKLRRKTIRFEHVEKILEILDYHIEIVENKH